MRFSRPALVFLGFVWVLVMLYPDPGVLVRSVRNISGAHADPAAAAELAAKLPDDPRLIEAHVLGTAYGYDWQTFGVPWYFPTAAEAIQAEQGDCESRALALASLLTAKDIPNELRVAINHIWVDYPGKQPTLLENAALEVAGHRDGSFFFKLPGDLDLGTALADQIEITWAPMPLWRLVLLLTGLALISSANVWTGFRRTRDGGSAFPSSRGLRATPSRRPHRRVPARPIGHAGKVR